MNTEKKQWISDKAFFWLVVGVSLTIPAVVSLLRFLPDEYRPTATFAHELPKVNAIINTLVTFTLIIGFWAIRVKRNKALHQTFMLISVVLSTLFLVSYVTYHYVMPHVASCHEGWIKYVYYFILLTHILLAAVILPMVLYTLYFSAFGKYEKHKKLARFTFPLWLYVSITGVLVYLFIAPCM